MILIDHTNQPNKRIGRERAKKYMFGYIIYPKTLLIVIIQWKTTTTTKTNCDVRNNNKLSKKNPVIGNMEYFFFVENKCLEPVKTGKKYSLRFDYVWMIIQRIQSC